jgi:hypothetical protein
MHYQSLLSNSAGVQNTNTLAAAHTEKMIISNISFADRGYGLGKAVGEIKNNDSAKYSVTIKATFIDGAGEVVGTASGAVNDVTAGKT